MDGEPERESLEADAVGGSAIDQSETGDGLGRAVNRNRKPRDRVDDDLTCQILLVSDDRFIRLILVGRKRVVLPVERAAADVRKEHAANAADDADRRECGLDDREAEFRVREEDVLARELKVVVSPHFRLPAEVREIGIIAPALEGAHARREHAGAGNARIVPEISIEGLAGQRRPNLRGDVVYDTHRSSRQRTKLPEDRRLLDEPDAEGDHGSVPEDRLPVGLELILLRIRLQSWVVVLLIQMREPGRELEASIPVQGIDGERRAALDRARGSGEVA